MEINWLTVGIGILFLGFGTYTLFMRKKNPEKFTKLEAMKKFWGEKTGQAVHVIAYSIVPIVLGAVSVFLGILGISLF